MPKQNIYYSDKYEDEKFEYRHVMLPKDLAKMVPKSHLMSETEWRSLGVQQSQVDAEYFWRQWLVLKHIYSPFCSTVFEDLGS